MLRRLPKRASWLELQWEARVLSRSFAAASDKLQLIKELRERSGSPISDVKAALEEAQYVLGKQEDSCLSWTLISQ